MIHIGTGSPRDKQAWKLVWVMVGLIAALWVAFGDAFSTRAWASGIDGVSNNEFMAAPL